MTVFMESEEFGYEEFSADNLADALGVVTRLYREAARLEDGITRKIGIIINN